MAAEPVRTSTRPASRRQALHATETKPFFLTSEFLAVVVTAIALAIAASTDDTVDGWRFWILTVALVGAYILSRGIAKAGSRSPAYDPREDLSRELSDRR